MTYEPKTIISEEYQNKVKSFKDYNDIDFCLLGKTEVEVKQNMKRVIFDIAYTADLKYVFDTYGKRGNQ